MSRYRVNSSPESAPASPEPEEQYDDSALEGVAANVKLLLKLIQDHKDACNKHKKDGRRMLRVATMMTILDNVRARIQKCQFGNKRSGAELQRSTAELSHSPVRESKNKDILYDEEKEELRKALNASMGVRKSLEIMCSSLGREKEIMAHELHKRVHQMNEMEELISDLKEQNQSLLEKVKECAREHKEKRHSGGETQGNAALQERNKELSEHLLRSLDGHRSTKKKLKEAQEENMVVKARMEETGEKVRASLERFRSFKENMASTSDPPVEIQKEIDELENMFECLQTQITKQRQNRGDYAKLKDNMNAYTPSIYA